MKLTPEKLEKAAKAPVEQDNNPEKDELTNKLFERLFSLLARAQDQWNEWMDKTVQVREERDAAQAELKRLQAEQTRREYMHHPLCNGDRRYPAGDAGHSCSCFSLHAPHTPQVGVPEDLLVKMRNAVWCDDQCPFDWVERMTAALRVVREDAFCRLPASPVVLLPDGTRLSIEDQRVLGAVTDKELAESVRPKWTLTEAIECVFASRRARLLPSKTVEERVTIENRFRDERTDRWIVMLDGAFKYGGEDAMGLTRDDAESYRLRLIAKLKQERQQH